MDKFFHPTVSKTYDYLSMLGLKLVHVSKSGPRTSADNDVQFRSLIYLQDNRWHNWTWQPDVCLDDTLRQLICFQKKLCVYIYLYLCLCLYLFLADSLESLFIYNLETTTISWAIISILYVGGRFILGISKQTRSAVHAELLNGLAADWSKPMADETKWTPFCRRHLQVHFLEWKSLHFDSSLTDFCTQWSN